MVSFQAALKQVMRKFAFASKASVTQTEIQRVYTGLGAEFGQSLIPDNITFAIKREPVAHRIVFAMCDFGCVFVAFEVYEVSVNEGVLDASMSEYLHYVENIFGAVVFHCGFPVAERMKADLHEPWVLEFLGYFSALRLGAFSHGVLYCIKDFN